jgi:hypothetical protein
MKYKKNTWMGRIREEVASRSTNTLINKYNTYNTEGRKATYDELSKRGARKSANFLRYGKFTRPVRKSTNAFGIRPINIGRMF